MPQAAFSFLPTFLVIQTKYIASSDKEKMTIGDSPLGEKGRDFRHEEFPYKHL